jgi:type I restriction enzyme R subunit
MSTDTSEKGLESLIEEGLLNGGYIKRTSVDYNKEFALDEGVLRQFLENTQRENVERTRIYASEQNTRKFYERLRNQITQRGVVDVLRHGVDHNATKFLLYYPTPVEGNIAAAAQYRQNKFAVVRQLHFSQNAPSLSVDMVLMLNGLPILAMELKNSISCQTTDDAVHQYKTDRDPKELLFQKKRCAVHFAVDDETIMMCTELKGEQSWFLPFNKGVDDGAGNPVNPNGLKTSYLWEDILQKTCLSDILENFASVIKEKDEDTGKMKEKVIWPRYHQLKAVNRLIADTKEIGRGHRYLIQHSAGSGKSNTITWLSFKLVNMKEQDGITPHFRSTIVVTDRVVLDKQIRNNIFAFINNKSIVAWADDSEALRKALSGGKSIVVTTIEKFPFILQTLGQEMANSNFAVVIDEAHSSQTGGMASALNRILAGYGYKGKQDIENEDGLNDLMEYVVAGRMMAKNVNFYAFTATPKNKTLEMFGVPVVRENGELGHDPFDLYSMKQAIEEGFILDVTKYYTTYDSFYKILKDTETNPEFDRDQAAKKLRVWVESRPETVEKKARIMVEHFHESICHKIGGEARCMVVCNGIERAIDYFFAIKDLLKQRNSPYEAIVAFSGTKEYKGKQLDETQLNKFPSSQIEKKFKGGNYRFLIVADKFQTGYDNPLLHTMYVDKTLTDIKAVQTLSRLNRVHPKKMDTCVLDFVNKAEDIQKSFQKYYKQTSLSRETDINKVSDLLATCDQSLVYTEEEVIDFNLKFWNGEPRQKLDPILDKCVERFNAIGEEEGEERQAEIKGAMKMFVRTYEYLAALMPYGNPDWEKKDTFFHFLIRKLPKLKREDWAEGLLELVDFDKYRVTKKTDEEIRLANENTEIEPVPVGEPHGYTDDPNMETLEKIVDDFNDIFGDIEWGDADLVKQQVKSVVQNLQKNDEVRDTLLNNDEGMQLQVVHDSISQELGVITANSSEMQRRYLSQPDIQQRLDALVLMRLQEQLNPEINERLLQEKLVEEFTQDFMQLCGVHYRSLEEVAEWLFKVLDAETIQSLDGIKKIRRIINLIYRTEGRTEDMQDWLQLLLSGFEPYMKKMYYLREGKELTREDGKNVQFLDAAKAMGVNKLHYDMPEEYNQMKTYYEFVHAQRNDTTHQAPVIEDKDVKPGIHMTMAMYLYSTMISITDMEMSGIIDGTPHVGSTAKVVSITDELQEDKAAKIVPYVTHLPFYPTLKAACHSFDEVEQVNATYQGATLNDDVDWIDVSNEMSHLDKSMFIVKAMGDSMMPKINDGDYCVFSFGVAGSHEGDIVLAELDRIYSGEDSACVIKKYHSEKAETEDSWEHTSIELIPLNSDYDTIKVEVGNEPRIIGVLKKVIRR